MELEPSWRICARILSSSIISRVLRSSRYATRCLEAAVNTGTDTKMPQNIDGQDVIGAKNPERPTLDEDIVIALSTWAQGPGVHVLRDKGLGECTSHIKQTIEYSELSRLIRPSRISLIALLDGLKMDLKLPLRFGDQWLLQNAGNPA
jgi:hypothetical protein